MSLTYEYIYNGSILAGVTWLNYAITYMYDNNGDIFGYNLDGANYYYVKNAQNDVTAITKEDGTIICRYYYDAWGNMTEEQLSTNVDDSFAISNNHITYRSYFYDSEINMYYLNSRYYSPDLCRFLNADGIVNANQDILGNNLFAYCSNNPVNFSDDSGCGKIWNWIKNAASTIKNWWNSTPPASSYTVPSTNQLVGMVSDTILGGTENVLKGKTQSQPWSRSSKGTIRGTPWKRTAKYPTEVKTASKGAAAIAAVTLSLDLANTWTENNSNTNGDRVLKSVVQITGAAAGVLVGVAAAAAFTAVSTVATPVAGFVTLAAIAYGGSAIIDYASNFYYDKVGIE